MSLSLRIQRNDKVVAHRISNAESFCARLFGLLGRKSFIDGEALILRGTRQVHMFFMRFPIDVVFCQMDGTVLHIEIELRPWRVSAFVPETAFIVELPSGTIRTHAIEPGDRLVISSTE